MQSQESKSTASEQIQGKKPYSAPQLVEHGSIEEITGTPSSGYSGSA